jgi:DNA-binding response OmpR family regulator
MNYPVVVVHEAEGRLVKLLRARVPERRWVLRQVSDLQDCRAILDLVRPTILVMEVSAKRPAAFEILEWIQENRQDVVLLVVLGPDAAGFAIRIWELGAKAVVWPERVARELPQRIEVLVDKLWSPAQAGGV